MTWIRVSQAMTLCNLTRRAFYNRISRGVLKTKKDGDWFVLVWEPQVRELQAGRNTNGYWSKHGMYSKATLASRRSAR